MLLQGKKLPYLQGPSVGSIRGDPITVTGQNRREKRPASYDVTERTRMFTGEGAPMHGTVGDIIGTFFPVAKPFIMAGDTIADLVRGKGGGMEGAIGDAFNSAFGAKPQRVVPSYAPPATVKPKTFDEEIRQRKSQVRRGRMGI